MMWNIKTILSVILLWLGCNIMSLTWTERHVPNDRSLGWQIINSSDDGSVIMATAYFDNNYLSTDGGVTWTLAEPNLSVVGGVWNPYVSFYWYDNAVSGDGNVLVLVASYDMEDADDNPIPNVYVSIDKGVTWSTKTIIPGYVNAPFYACCCDYDGSHIIVTDWDDGGAYLSTDYGATWTLCVDGASPAPEFYSVAISADGGYIYAGGGDECLYKSIDEGENWTVVYTDGDSKPIHTLYCSSDGSTILMSIYGSYTTLQLSTDYGSTWTPKTCGDSSEYWRCAMSRDGNIMGARNLSDEFWLSEDGGSTWTDQALGEIFYYTIAFDYDGSRRFFAGPNVYEQIEDVWTKIYPQSGGLFTWFDWSVNGGDISSTGQYQVMYASHIYGHVYYSSDYGVTWSDVSPYSGRTGFDWRCARMSRDGSKLLVGSQDDKLYYSSDRGSTWLLCDRKNNTKE